MSYSDHIQTEKKLTAKTPQNQKTPGKVEVKNSAGGYVFEVDDWKMLDRFLILGTEGGTYYASEKKLTRKNFTHIQKLIKTDGLNVVKRVVEISESGRAPKNEAAIFVLAAAAKTGNLETRKAAYEALPRVCRIGTHLFQFVKDAEIFGGWGRSMRNGVANWYRDKNPNDLAYQVIKYQQRDKWSHRDLLRLSHAHAPSEAHTAIFRWVTHGVDSLDGVEVKHRGRGGAPEKTVKLDKIKASALPEKIRAFEQAKTASETELVTLIIDHGLPHECVPTDKRTPRVWEALLENMPMTALIRNLATLTKVGLIKGMSDATKKAVTQLQNADRLKKARVHPIQLLSALRTYSSGRSVKGKATWNPEPLICTALEDAFYLAFQTVEPTGKNFLLALDVSGSMGQGAIAGVPGLTPRTASAVMAMVTARTEQWHQFIGFTGQGFSTQRNVYGSQNGVSPLRITPRMDLKEVESQISGLPFGNTDCALPMLYASATNAPVDTFVIYTDNETWVGDIKPFQALKAYRNKSGRDAKLVVVGMTATKFSIADPSDAGMLDVVGFDTAAPQMISAFASNRF